MSSTAVILFTRDLRTHDHPALAAATRSHDEVVPLFVLDDRLLRRSANRASFPDGEYVRRFVPELHELGPRDIHEPWRLGRPALAELGYPPPLVEL